MQRGRWDDEGGAYNSKLWLLKWKIGWLHCLLIFCDLISLATLVWRLGGPHTITPTSTQPHFSDISPKISAARWRKRNQESLVVVQLKRLNFVIKNFFFFFFMFLLVYSIHLCHIFCSQLVLSLVIEEGCGRLMASMKFSHYKHTLRCPLQTRIHVTNLD